MKREREGGGEEREGGDMSRKERERGGVGGREREWRREITKLLSRISMTIN